MNGRGERRRRSWSFGPLQPDDEDLIFVAFTADPTPADWIGTVA
ncbi:hypothetical protein [Kribbella sp. NPDC051620]